MEDELSLKRNIEQRRAEKEEMDRVAASESRLTRMKRRRPTRFAGGDDARGIGGGAKARGGQGERDGGGDRAQGGSGMYVKPVSKLIAQKTLGGH